MSDILEEAKAHHKILVNGLPEGSSTKQLGWLIAEVERLRYENDNFAHENHSLTGDVAAVVERRAVGEKEIKSLQSQLAQRYKLENCVVSMRDGEVAISLDVKDGVLVNIGKFDRYRILPLEDFKEMEDKLAVVKTLKELQFDDLKLQIADSESLAEKLAAVEKERDNRNEWIEAQEKTWNDLKARYEKLEAETVELKEKVERQNRRLFPHE